MSEPQLPVAAALRSVAPTPMVWAACTPAAADTAFNVVDGDVFRRRHLWPRIAEHLGVDPEGPVAEPRRLAVQMAGLREAWSAIAAREGLVEPDLGRVASWWHTDADLGRPFAVFADMGRSRDRGFTGHRRTQEAVLRAPDRYREARTLPSSQGRIARRRAPRPPGGSGRGAHPPGADADPPCTGAVPTRRRPGRGPHPSRRGVRHTLPG